METYYLDVTDRLPSPALRQVLLDARLLEQIPLKDLIPLLTELTRQLESLPPFKARVFPVALSAKNRGDADLPPVLYLMAAQTATRTLLTWVREAEGGPDPRYPDLD